MSAMPRWFKPLKQIVDAIFRHDLALRRDAEGVRLVLNDRSGGSGKGRIPDKETAAKERQEVKLMRSQLVKLLDERPETRNAMRHLAFVEQALGKKGLRALDKLPLQVMRHALSQLEGLVTNWSPVGLANLRSKMAVAIIEREHMDPDAEADAYRTAAVLDTDPDELPLDGSQGSSDDDALAAAYAALGDAGPSAVEMQPELGSPSARAVAQALPSPAVDKEPIKLREFQA
jgi:hypothetical protein